MKIYGLVKKLLEENAELRDSDKKLIWRVWYEQGDAGVGVIDIEHFMHATSSETIRRCRQKIQETHPELQSSKWIRKQREKIAEQNGTFIYKEEVQENLI